MINQGDGTKVLWNKEAEINNPYQPLKEDNGTIPRPDINIDSFKMFIDKDWFMNDKTIILDNNNG